MAKLFSCRPSVSAGVGCGTVRYKVFKVISILGSDTVTYMTEAAFQMC